VFLIPKDRILFFEKSDYYIQKIFLPPNIADVDDVFLTENVVAEFCNSIRKITDRDWWIYAACHTAKLRIIAGIGKGIILSRFLSGSFNISDEISKTIMYLQRFGMTESVKIFSSPLTEKIHSKIVTENIYIENSNDMVLAVSDFLLKNNQIKPIFSRGNYIRKILNEKFLYSVALVIALVLLQVDKSFEDCQNSVLLFEKSTRAANDAIALEINDKNFSVAKQFIDKIKKMQNPLQLFYKASKICYKYRICVEQLLYDSGIKIKTSLNKSKFEELKNCVDVTVEKISKDEYEEPGSDKKIGSFICIK
jgi:hypothetical protein